MEQQSVLHIVVSKWVMVINVQQDAACYRNDATCLQSVCRYSLAKAVRKPG